MVQLMYGAGTVEEEDSVEVWCETGNDGQSMVGKDEQVEVEDGGSIPQGWCG